MPKVYFPPHDMHVFEDWTNRAVAYSEKLPENR